MAMNDKRILCVGVICLDELLYCENYPVEDSLEIFVREQLESYGVNLKHCEILENKELPISVCIINKKNGSRTILHHGGEWKWVSYEAFLKIDLSQYAWIHLEVRNFEHLKKMVKRIHAWNSGKRRPIPMSLEMEHYDDQCLEMMHTADLVMVSKDFAKTLGYKSMSDTLDGLYGYLKPSATLVVPWGEEGAAAKSPEGVFVSPAYPPERVLDTLGAGDTFCAALLSALSGGRPLQHSLRYACQVAGAKVGMHGYRGLRDVLRERDIRCHN